MMRLPFYRQFIEPFTTDVVRAASEHAIAAWPNESCGMVISGAYVACENVHEVPERAFRIARDIQDAAVLSAGLQGIIHSHPGGPPHPSAADMAGQISSGLPWAIIVSGPDGADMACHWGLKRPPLFDAMGVHQARHFLHGVSDCYTLCQDWFAEVRGIDLPDIARQWMWWKSPERYGDLYLDNLASAGFEVISRDPAEFARIAQPGDAFLRRLMSATPNHAGIYLGENLCLEQLPKSLSHRRPIGPALHVITHWLRFRGSPGA